MRIRRGGINDWPFIFNLSCSAAEASISPWRKQPMEETIKYRRKCTKGLWNWIQQTGSIVFIAEAEAEKDQGSGKEKGLVPVGYLILNPGNIEELTGLPQAWVMDIAVLPDYQGKGLAKAMLKEAEKYCVSVGLSYLGLAVTSHNLRALKLYEEMGFVEERKLMVKVLS